MRHVIILFSIVLISGCRSTEQSSLPVQETAAPLPKEWEVVVKEDFQSFVDIKNLSKRIYVFPPVRIDVNGQPYDHLDIEIGIDGERYCVTTNLLAIRLQQKTSNLMLHRNDMELLSYEDFLRMGGQRDVAALTSYYSDPIYPSAEVDDSGARVEMVYFHTELFSLSSSMDLEERRHLKNQKLFIRYHSDVAWEKVLFRTFPYLISNLGTESQSIKQLYWSDLELKSE